MQKAPSMTRKDYTFIADRLGPLVGWPSQILDMADALAETNPRFDRDKFIQRATAAWEKQNPAPEIDDEIPY
jgi:hypothetical protein